MAEASVPVHESAKGVRELLRNVLFDLRIAKQVIKKGKENMVQAYNAKAMQQVKAILERENPALGKWFKPIPALLDSLPRDLEKVGADLQLADECLEHKILAHYPWRLQQQQQQDAGTTGLRIQLAAFNTKLGQLRDIVEQVRTSFVALVSTLERTLPL